MNQKEIENIHSQLLTIYNNLLLPIVNKYFNNEINEAYVKSGVRSSTLVTEADLAINKVLFKELPGLVPNSTIISEESNDNTISEYTFIIDPIDGTHSFARSLDDWGISIALCENEKVIYSVIFFPKSVTQYYYAIEGLGAFDDKANKVTPSKLFEFKPTFLSAPSSREIGRALINYSKGKMLSFRTAGSAVYAAYTIFRGGTDFVVYDGLSIWDIVGCVFISLQSGLKVEWLSEAPKYNNLVDLKKTSYTLVIYKPDFDKKLLNEMMTVIKSARKT